MPQRPDREPTLERRRSDHPSRGRPVDFVTYTSAPAHLPPGDSERPLPEGKDPMTKRVLVVDDSMLMRRMICETLVDAGWEIAGEGEDGAQAIGLYGQLRPDAVTMDIVMPCTDGLVALEEILKIDPDARVVVVSALNQTKLISQAIRKGAQDFIAKPFLPEQLQATLASCIAEPVRG